MLFWDASIQKLPDILNTCGFYGDEQHVCSEGFSLVLAAIVLIHSAPEADYPLPHVEISDVEISRFLWNLSSQGSKEGSVTSGSKMGGMAEATAVILESTDCVCVCV